MIDAPPDAVHPAPVSIVRSGAGAGARCARSCALAILFSFVFAFLGCGGDDDGARPATPTATLPPPTTTLTATTAATPTATASPTPVRSASATVTPTQTPTASPTPTEDAPIVFGEPGSIAAPSGRGSFRFGVATAATQIEDQNPDTDWYLWTAPEPDGLARGPFVGDAVEGFSRAIDDVALIERVHLDVYRFSVEWARVEPERDAVNEGALEHYDRVIDALVATGIRPSITVHHFSSPVWVDDPRVSDCPDGPSDANLCGWGDPQGAEQIIDEIAEHAAELGRRYGDRVDDWASVNEPVNYLVASYGVGLFPPGRALIVTDFDRLIAVFRNYIRAHVAIYDALKKADTIDADGDGVAAQVGFTLNAVEWLPSRDNRPSDDPEDVAAAERIRYVYHYLFPDAVIHGGFDSDLDGVRDEDHPEWAGKLDWMGVQYYSRQGVSAVPSLIPRLNLTVCFGDLDFGACVPPAEPTHFVPAMNYEYYEPGLYNALVDFSARWPGLPLTVTESGLATENGVRRAEHVVRSLEQIERAIDDGADVRGYYHWSLTDNFEWALGFVPRFGLYRIDYDTFERTPTEGATTLAEIATTRRITQQMLDRYGGLGPMSPEREVDR